MKNLAVVLLRVFEIGAGPLLHQSEMRGEVSHMFLNGAESVELCSIGVLINLNKLQLTRVIV